MTFTIPELIAMFFIYAFLGWCVEVAYAACRTGHFVNRGFLSGPICPIYGFGVVGVIVALSPLQDHLILLFLGSILVTSLLEFVTGWALEKIFHTRWWDYSNNHFNIKGYICLGFSIIWGLAATFVVRLIHPAILRAIRFLPFPLLLALEGIFTVLIIVDLVAVIAKARHFSDRVKLLCDMAEEIHTLSDKIGDSISGTVLAVKTKADSGREVYADYDTLCREHRKEEKALYDQHEAEEAALLEQIRQTSPHATGARVTEEGSQQLRSKTKEWQMRLRETRSSYKRFLAAFPTLHPKNDKNGELMEKIREKDLPSSESDDNKDAST